MARPLRMERAGAWHHVTARGNERRAIYRDEKDRAHFCQLLGETVKVFAWRLHAYVLMENHYHLLVETPEPNLGRGMQWLNTSYSVWFNRRCQRVGHLFQGRFKSIVVDPAGWALALSRYVHLNPVRVGGLGLDKSARQRDRVGVGGKPAVKEVQGRVNRLRGYRWSSYRAYVGLAKAPSWLRCERILELGGGRQQRARVSYRRYVEAAIRQGLGESPWENLRAQTALGGAEFARRVAGGLGLARRNSRRRRELARPTVAQIIAAVEEVKGEKWERFRDRHGDWGRDMVFYLGRKDWAVKLRELGDCAGGTEEMAVSVAARRFAQRVPKEPELTLAQKQCRQKLQMFYV